MGGVTGAGLGDRPEPAAPGDRTPLGGHGGHGGLLPGLCLAVPAATVLLSALVGRG